MKITKTIFVLGMVMAVALAFPDKQHDHMQMMKHKSGQMMMDKSQQQLSLSLPSVQCDMCKNTIETGMAKVAGVNSITVDVDNKTAQVMYDPSVIDPESIEKSIAGLGYWANETAADPDAYQNLAGCCQMTNEEYNQMMKKSGMDHGKMEGSMMGRQMMGNTMMSHGEMGKSMDSHPDNQKIAMAMVDLPTIQCGMCEARIERELPKVGGIISVDVIVDKNMGHIMYDPDILSVTDIENAIANIGYQANETPADAKAYQNLPGCCKVK